jgi:hypothetical protein
MQQMVALKPRLSDGGVRLAGCGPHKKIDDVLMTPVDQSGHGAVVQVVEPAAYEWKALVSEVADRRREIQLSVEPRLDCVLVRRRHIGEVGGHERSNVTSHDVPSQQLRGGRAADDRGNREGRDQHSSGNSDPLPRVWDGGSICIKFSGLVQAPAQPFVEAGRRTEIWRAGS